MIDLSKINPGLYKHASDIQVRFADCDMAGHVNNATILTYFETARIDFFHDVIGTDNDWNKTGLILAHSEIDYLAPVYLQDKVKAYSRVTRIGNKSFNMENLLVKVKDGKETFAAIASFVLVCMDYSKKQTIEIPKSWIEKLDKFEKQS